MTRAEFEEKTFEECMEQLSLEYDNITTLDTLKDYIKEAMDDNNFDLAAHLCNAIWNDPDSLKDSEWYDYDYCMGTLDRPICLCEKADVEHLIED